MRSYDERKAAIDKFLLDYRSVITMTEAVSYLYHWFGLERAISRSGKFDKLMEKHTIALDKIEKSALSRKKS